MYIKKLFLMLIIIIFVVSMFSVFIFSSCKAEEKAPAEEAAEEEAAEEAAEEEETPSTEEIPVLKVASYKDETATEAVALKDYAQNNGFEVEWVTIPASDYSTKILMELTSGEADYDLLYANNFRTAMWSKFLMDISNEISDQVKKDIISSALESLTVNGILHGVPVFMNPQILNYNKKVFEEKGINKMPENLDELISTAEKCVIDEDKDGVPEVYGFSTSGDFMFGTYFVKFIDSAGGNFYTDNKEPDFNNEYGIRALNLLKVFYTSEWVDPSSISVLEPEVRNTMASGKVAMAMVGTGSAAILVKTNFPEMEGNIGFALMPGDKGSDGALPGAKEYLSTFKNCFGFVVPELADNLDEALGFLDYMISYEGQKIMTDNFGTASVNKVVASDPKFYENYSWAPLSVEIAEKATFSQGEKFIQDEYFNAVRAAMLPIIQEFLISSKDVQTTLDNLEAAVIEVRSN